MNISAPFIRRPIGTSLLTIALFLAGVLGFRFVPVAPLPQVECPVIQVSAAMLGASPENLASSVATPLERQFGRISGVIYLHPDRMRPGFGRMFGGQRAKGRLPELT